MPVGVCDRDVDLTGIYQCLSDRTRRRILRLLQDGPLCVCHFQAVMREPQVKVSKHLAYLRGRGLVVARRDGPWMVYALPARPPAALAANLACLRECGRGDPILARDAIRRARLARRPGTPAGCALPGAGSAPVS